MRGIRSVPAIAQLLLLLTAAVAASSCQGPATAKPDAGAFAAPAAEEEEAASFLEKHVIHGNWHGINCKRDVSLPGKPVVELEIHGFFWSECKPEEIPQLTEAIRKLKHLKRIDARCSSATDACLKGLSYLKNLEELNLWGINRFTEAGLIEIGKITSLKSLNVTGMYYEDANKVTNKGVAYLVGLKNLETLEIGYNKITDAGLKPLGQMKNLKRLDLKGNPVTSAGIEDLKRALPKTEILGP